MYNFMQRRVKEMNGDLQIIVVDHAEDLDDNFRQSTIEHCTCQQKLDTKLKKSGIKNESMYKIHQLF